MTNSLDGLTNPFETTEENNREPEYILRPIQNEAKTEKLKRIKVLISVAISSIHIIRTPKTRQMRTKYI